MDVEWLLDLSRWDWRADGVTVRLAYHPDRCCHWGVYDTRTKTIWIGPPSLRHPKRLRYVALHELAHAWQWSSGHMHVIQSDMRRHGLRGVAALEAAADCVAMVWGGRPGHYRDCPREAQGQTVRRLNEDWS